MMLTMMVPVTIRGHCPPGMDSAVIPKLKKASHA